MTEGLVAGGVISVALGALVWIVKRMVVSLIFQNKLLVEEALVNMRANTAAVGANTAATNELAQDMRTERSVREERDRTLFKQLDRIEDQGRRTK